MTLVEAPPVPLRSSSSIARPAILLGVLATVVTWAGSWIPSYWGDEAASVLSAQRSVPSLLAELSTVDAVHGLYYAFLKGWISLFGATELSTRFPSAIAVGLMVAGVVVLARRFGTVRFAILAGIICTILPRTTFLGTEARSYAMTAALAVWVTVLLLRLVEARTTSTWAWIAYGVAMAASIYLFLYLALMLAVHAVYLAIAHRAALRSWAKGAVVTGVLSAPFVAIAFMQRDQISFLANRHYANPANVLVMQWFDPLVVGPAWALILVLLIALLRRRLDGSGATLALLWLALPTAAVLIGNLLSPMYNVRYLSFSTPAAALAIAGGILVVARFAATRWRRPVAGLLVVVLAALALPGYLEQRGPYAKDGGNDWRQAAAYVGEHAKPGDAVLFEQGIRPSRDPRLALRLYPDDFAGLRDIALVTPYWQTSGLWDEVAPNTEVNLQGTSDLWALEMAQGTKVPTDIRFLEGHGFRVADSILINRTVVYHLVRDPS